MIKVNSMDGKVKFKVTEILDARKTGSTIEIGKVFTGVRKGNCVYFTDMNEQEWVFYVGDTCEIVKVLK